MKRKKLVPKKSASLTVVGSGIKFLSHLTTEAKAYIKRADLVIYLVNEPAMQSWLQQNSKRAVSLDEFYAIHQMRYHCYQEMTKFILQELYKEQHVCVVIYGHPTKFAKPALDAVLVAIKEGYDARILPGISAEDCLYADLLINPSNCGCLSFEATDFLIYGRKPNPQNHLILWQVGIVGELSYPRGENPGLKILLNYLLSYYPQNHQVVIYEAAQYPHLQPKIINTPLSKLTEVHLSPISTLYVPPSEKSTIDHSMLKILNIDISETKIVAK